MITEEVKVLWPPRLGLFAPQVKQAYEMGFKKENILRQDVGIHAAEEPQSLQVLRHKYECLVIDAYYLPRVTIRRTDMKPLPEGRLNVVLDGETLVDRELSFFLPPAKPLDCLQPYSWGKTVQAYPAFALIRESSDTEDCQVDHTRQIGVMITNNLSLEVNLTDLDITEKTTFEVSVLTALYTTKKESKP